MILKKMKYKMSEKLQDIGRKVVINNSSSKFLSKPVAHAGRGQCED
jgi:hypothetical protein